jgi:hypothetical protein
MKRHRKYKDSQEVVLDFDGEAPLQLDQAGLDWIGSNLGITTGRAIVPVLVPHHLQAYLLLNGSFRLVRRGLFVFHVLSRVRVGVRLPTTGIVSFSVGLNWFSTDILSDWSYEQSEAISRI